MEAARLFEVSQFLDDFTTLPQWPISCYAPSKSLPIQLLDGCDQQPEEIRLLYYVARNNSTVDAAHEETSCHVKSVQEKIKTIENHQSQAANYIGIVQKSTYNKYNSSINTASKPPTFFEYLESQGEAGPSSTGFGASAQSNQGSVQGAFGQSATTAFDQPSQPAFGTSSFGQNNQVQSAFGKPVFGQASGSQGSAFTHTASNASPFGQIDSSFNKPAFGASVFGQALVNTTINQPPTQPGFGQPAFSKPAFGQTTPTQSAFGQNPGPQPAFGQTQSAFGQTGFSKPFFGQPAFGQSGFGQAAVDKPAFGQSSLAQASLAPPAFGQTAFGRPAFEQPAFGRSAFGQSQNNSQMLGQTTLQPAFGAQPFNQNSSNLQPVSNQVTLPSPAFGNAPGPQPAFGRSAFGQTGIGNAAIPSVQPAFGQPVTPAFGTQTQSQPNTFITPPQTNPLIKPAFQAASSTGQFNAPFKSATEKSSNIYSLMSEDKGVQQMSSNTSQTIQTDPFSNQVQRHNTTQTSNMQTPSTNHGSNNPMTSNKGKSGILQSFTSPWQKYGLDRVQRGDFQIETFNDDPENQIQPIDIENYKKYRFDGQVPLAAPTREIALGLI